MYQINLFQIIQQAIQEPRPHSLEHPLLQGKALLHSLNLYQSHLKFQDQFQLVDFLRFHCIVFTMPPYQTVLISILLKQ